MALAPKAFELLTFMVSSGGRLLRREELMEAVWRDSFVEEINLTVNISLLRKVLASEPEGVGYIVTVPKRGYRFTPAVTEEAGTLDVDGRAVADALPPRTGESPETMRGTPVPQAGAETMVTVEPGAAGAFPLFEPASSLGSQAEAGLREPALAILGRKHRWALAIATTLVAILLVVSWRVWAGYRGTNLLGNETAITRSLAVLPFQFIGPDANLAYLGPGMTDALVTRLSSQGTVAIRPLGAVKRYAGTNDLVQAGRDLQVDAVLDGTVQQAGSQTRVNVRLLRVASGTVIWTGTFDENSAAAFALEDAITERLAQALTLHLTEQQQHRLGATGTRNPEAYDLYTRGRVLLGDRSVQSVRKSIGLFEQAIAADSNYAAAYAGLADAYILAGSYGNSFLAPMISAPKAKEALTKALALNGDSAEAHTSLAYLHFVYDWNWGAAEEEFRRALSLDPSYVNAHHWYAHELLAQGRTGEAHDQSQAALALDPTDVLTNEHMAWHHLFARQYDIATTQALKAVEIDPNFVQAHRVLGLAYLYQGDATKACPEFRTGVLLTHEDPVALAYLARCYALTHREGAAREIAAQLAGASKERYISAAEIAAIYAALDERAIALQWLQQAADERASALVYMNIDPVFDRLRTEPAFAAILTRVGLPTAKSADPAHGGHT